MASRSPPSRTVFRPRWECIRQQLLDGTYQPQPVRDEYRSTNPMAQALVRYSKLNRPLDPTSHRANLTPIFDPSFSASIFGFRPKRFCHGAAAKQVSPHDPQRISLCRRHGSFQILRPRTARCAQGTRLKESRRQATPVAHRTILARSVMVDGLLQATVEGTPQGALLLHRYSPTSSWMIWIKNSKRGDSICALCG